MVKVFDKLSPFELASVSREAKGKKLLVVVHPSWKEKGYKTLTPFFRANRHHNYVVLIFDGHSRIEEVSKRIAHSDVKDSDLVFFVRTKSPFDPQPVIGWQKLIGKINSIGIKKIIVGGQLIGEGPLSGLKDVIANIKMMYPPGTNIDKILEESRAEYTLSSLRTMKRAALNKKTQRAYYGCAGYTYSKLAANPKFKVKLQKKLN